MGGRKVLVTDRFGPPGPGMMYMYDVGSLANGDAGRGDTGAPPPSVRLDPERTWPLGADPQYTTIVGDGAVVSANDKGARGKGTDNVRVNFIAGLLQRDNTTGDYTVRNATAPMADAAAPRDASFVLDACGPDQPPSPPPPPPGPKPPPPPGPKPPPPPPGPPPGPPPSPPRTKKCPSCRGGECGCSWAKPSSCQGSGDGSCCFKCCCDK